MMVQGGPFRKGAIHAKNSSKHNINWCIKDILYSASPKHWELHIVRFLQINSKQFLVLSSHINTFSSEIQELPFRSNLNLCHLNDTECNI